MGSVPETLDPVPVPGMPEPLSISGLKFTLNFYKTPVKCPHSK